ncbi:hypothetical protein [Spiroplasma endosymbiont of Amphimallon solstitiale]|uniref:hypothetical protein n=1 Tax=Spiroplasma endosymbiont of Amphimallon solstitiale TaxID=3066288 RepID=UPI00313C9862
MYNYFYTKLKEFCEKYIYIHNGVIKEAGNVKDIVKNMVQFIILHEKCFINLNCKYKWDSFFKTWIVNINGTVF